MLAVPSEQDDCVSLIANEAKEGFHIDCLSFSFVECLFKSFAY